jgi:hypothetical protein
MVVTDHRSIRAKREGYEGWYGNVLLIIGEEIGRTEGHFIAVGHERGLRHLSEGLESELRSAGAAGAATFITHPDGRGSLPLGINDHRWKMRDAESFDGLEIWSFMHDWLARLRPWNLPAAAFHPPALLRGPAPETLAVWDHLGRTRRVAGFGGLDGHSRKVLGLFWDFPYSTLFRTIRTHVLVPPPERDAVRDRDAVIRALAAGRGHLANDLLADSRGFRFQGWAGDRMLLPGDEGEFREPAALRVRCPAPPDTVLRLLRDGTVIDEIEGGELRKEVGGPGVYRVEATLRGEPWIFSNPIYLR